MSELPLIVLAAGLSTRYGRLKQVDPLGPSGESIMDYNVFDAARAGFTRAVFVVRPEIEETVRRHVLGIVGKRFPVSFVHQTTEQVPEGFRAPPERKRPWGTAQAVLCARAGLDGPFGVCNADDLYGPDAFRRLAEHLLLDPPQTEAALVGYKLSDTLSGQGGVARGVCVLGHGGLLERVTEVRQIRRVEGWIAGVDTQGGTVELQGDEVVSMNLWGFTPVIVESLTRQFRRFMDGFGGDTDAEFFLSTALSSQVHVGHTRVAVLQADDRWFGVTHAGDREQAQAHLADRIADGQYPDSLHDAFESSPSPNLTGASVQLTTLDWTVIAGYGVLALAVGLYFARRAGRGTDEFFLGGRSMPWWLLGTSMVATTFSTDTPNLVTDLVRTGGVSQNWLWWAFVITGMCTVFFYAKLWRRSGILTDVGFYELRYSGRPAAFLRGFRAIYLGVFFNVMIMATVTLAAIKIGGVVLGANKYEVVIVAGTVTALYSATSGLWGVVVTDLMLFVIAMVGSFAAAYYAVVQPEVGGLAGLFTNPALDGKLSLLPDFTDMKTASAVFIVPIAVQWWSTWYPGAEPGGGGYVAQRMLAAKDEKNALQATLWFNVAHYALRPWPWIIVALASLIIYPSLESIQVAFPHIDPSIVRHDLAYPAMLVFLPSGLLGLVVASLAAAYMSTISTHLNWGASYVVDDVYRRFVNDREEERHYVRVGRAATVLLIVLAGGVSLWLENALQAFQILLQIGAGTGLVFLLRWFWWRINAWSELSAMVISFFVAVYFQFAHQALGFQAVDPSLQLVLGVLVTTVGWVSVTYLTAPADKETLQSFHRAIRPMGRGWDGAGIDTGSGDVHESPAAAFLAWFLGCLVVYGAVFGTGYALYGNFGIAAVCLAVTAASAWRLLKLLPMVGLR